MLPAIDADVSDDRFFERRVARVTPWERVLVPQRTTQGVPPRVDSRTTYAVVDQGVVPFPRTGRNGKTPLRGSSVYEVRPPPPDAARGGRLSRGHGGAGIMVSAI